MSLLSALLAILSAFPPFYFALKLRILDRNVAVLSTFLFFALFAHAINHLMVALDEFLIASAIELISVISIFCYAFFYWKTYTGQET